MKAFYFLWVNVLLSAILYVGLTACGSATTYSFAGKKIPLVKIVDSGEMYSTYTLEKEDRKSLISQGITDAQIRIIEMSSMETSDNWPAGIKTLDDRNENRAQLNNYKGYKVGTIDSGSKVILLIPAKQNGHMPANMRPIKDIYFIIGSSGLGS